MWNILHQKRGERYETQKKQVRENRSDYCGNSHYCGSNLPVVLSAPEHTVHYCGGADRRWYYPAESVRCFMKVVVVKSPKLLKGLLKMMCKVK